MTEKLKVVFLDRFAIRTHFRPLRFAHLARLLHLKVIRSFLLP
jgi:hypothetical protein